MGHHLLRVDAWLGIRQPAGYANSTAGPVFGCVGLPKHDWSARLRCGCLVDLPGAGNAAIHRKAGIQHAIRGRRGVHQASERDAHLVDGETGIVISGPGCPIGHRDAEHQRCGAVAYRRIWSSAGHHAAACIRPNRGVAWRHLTLVEAGPKWSGPSRRRIAPQSDPLEIRTS